MKTAEDFRRELGEAEESFARCVRQTLMDCECEEEKPVKKKISMGLVLAAAIMLLTAGALAAGAWGIISFLEGQGKTAAEDQLLELQAVTYGENMVRINIEEGFYESGQLYLAVTAKPLIANTLVVPMPDADTELGIGEMFMREAMQSDAYAADVSVMEYAQAMGLFLFEPEQGPAERSGVCRIRPAGGRHAALHHADWLYA